MEMDLVQFMPCDNCRVCHAVDSTRPLGCASWFRWPPGPRGSATDYMRHLGPESRQTFPIIDKVCCATQNEDGRTMNDNLVLCQRQGRVVTVTLNRPEKLNALTPEMLEAFTTVMIGLRDDPETRCVVLRGAGESAFSAGFDIGRIGQDAPRPGENDPRVADSYLGPKTAMHLYPYPIIAMIHGYCVGGGLDLAVACDLRIAADTARLGITPAKLGIVYNYDPIRAFVDLVGPGYAKELFCLGRLVDAQRALTMGLVNYVLPEAELELFTYALAEEIAGNAPLPVQAAKTIINRTVSDRPITPEDEAAFARVREAAAVSEDLREGRQAFLEKRAPRFQGR